MSETPASIASVAPVASLAPVAPIGGARRAFVERRASPRRRSDAPEGAGVLVFDDRLRLRLASDTLVALLDLPAELVSATPPLADLLGGGRLSAGARRAVLRLCAAALAADQGFEGSALIDLRTGLAATLRVRRLSPGRWIASFEPLREVPGDRALRDPLTGLLGATMLLDRLRAALAGLAGDGQIGLLVLDFDGFAGVNERLGRATGDAVLRAAASRLRAALRADDVLVRLEADRFAVLQGAAADAAATAMLIARLLELLRQPYVVKGRLLQIDASIGHALAPRDAMEADTLLGHAEAMLHEAKAIAARRAARVGRVPDAVLADPVEAGEAAISAAWRFDDVTPSDTPPAPLRVRPRRETAAPRRAQRDAVSGEVIGYLAGRTTRGGPAGLREAAAAARELRRPGDDPRRSRSWPLLTLQAGARELADPTALLDALYRAAGAADLSFADLQVQVDGDALEAAGTLACLAAVRAAGARICLGGFGRPGAPIDALARFTFDAVMLHRDVLKPAPGVDQAALLRGMVALARSLGATVGVAGVSEAAQREQARLAGCLVVQDEEGAAA